jgi:hypothetical protein
MRKVELEDSHRRRARSHLPRPPAILESTRLVRNAGRPNCVEDTQLALTWRRPARRVAHRAPGVRCSLPRARKDTMIC